MVVQGQGVSRVVGTGFGAGAYVVWYCRVLMLEVCIISFFLLSLFCEVSMGWVGLDWIGSVVDYWCLLTYRVVLLLFG